MINASMQQPLSFMFSFSTIIRPEHISKSQPAWPQRIMGHSTCLCPSTLIIIVTGTMTTGTLIVLLAAEDATDSGFTPTTGPICVITSDDCFSDLCHFKCLQKGLCTFEFFQRDVIVFHKHQGRAKPSQPIFHSDISEGGRTADARSARGSNAANHEAPIGVLWVIFK